MYVTVKPEVVVLGLLLNCAASEDSLKFGHSIGLLDRGGPHVHFAHVWIADRSHILVRSLVYDGQCPDTHFLVGIRGIHDAHPSYDGLVLADETGSYSNIGSYHNAFVILRLPEEYSTDQIIWLSIWCKGASSTKDLASIYSYKNSVPVVPKEVILGHFGGQNGVSGQVIALNNKQMILDSFSLDLNSPVIFWVSNDDPPSSNGVQVPIEGNDYKYFTRYNKQRAVLTLPGTVLDSGKTLDTVKTFAIWNDTDAVDYVSLNVSTNVLAVDLGDVHLKHRLSNCENLDRDFHVSWEVDANEKVIYFEYKAILLDEWRYAAFGVSGSSDELQLEGADLIVASYSHTEGSHVKDYYISAHKQCVSDNMSGVCYDAFTGGNSDTPGLVWGKSRDGVVTIRFQRYLYAEDSSEDQAIDPEAETNVVWAVGSLDQNTLLIKQHDRAGTKTIQFGRNGGWNCPELANDQFEPYSSCASSPCVNLGTCIDQDGGGFTCQCASPSFSGIRCQFKTNFPQLLVESSSWLTHEGFQYYVSSPGDTRSFDQAVEACNDMHADLASIPDRATLNWLLVNLPRAEQCSGRSRNNHNRFWIGLVNNEQRCGVPCRASWTWMDGTPLSRTWTTWGVHEPKVGHDIAQLYYCRYDSLQYYVSTWQSESKGRNEREHYLCKKALSTETTTVDFDYGAETTRDLVEQGSPDLGEIGDNEESNATTESGPGVGEFGEWTDWVTDFTRVEKRRIKLTTRDIVTVGMLCLALMLACFVLVILVRAYLQPPPVLYDPFLYYFDDYPEEGLPNIHSNITPLSSHPEAEREQWAVDLHSLGAGYEEMPSQETARNKKTAATEEQQVEGEDEEKKEPGTPL